MDFTAELKRLQALSEKGLKDLLPKKEPVPGRIVEAMSYSLLSGGKRIRPVLLLASARALSGDEKSALPFACAMEMIHTYSLIHDDLPAMDNDDYRRGRLTSHKVFGDGVAVLSGDALLNYAFETAANAEFPDSKKVEIMKIMGNASGIFGMIGGQVADLEGEKTPLSAIELSDMHRKKTGALIRASVAIGCVCAGEDKDTYDSFADRLGLAFQLKDDILDETSSLAVLGKNVGMDENKSTFIKLYGLEKTEEMLVNTTNEALSSLDNAKGETAFLRELALYLLRRTK